MNLLDRIRAAKPDDDLMTALGLDPGGRLTINEKGLTVAGETFPIAAVLNAMRKRGEPTIPARTVEIRDLAG